MTRHFENAIESFGGVFGEEGFDVIFEGVEDEVGTGIDAELSAVGGNFGGEDVFCAEAFADRDGEKADRAESCDENIFAFNGAIHDGVHGVAEGIEHRCNVFGDAGGDGAGVHRRDDGVGGESAIDIDAEELGGSVDVSKAIEVVGGVWINDVGFAGDKIADFSVVDVVGDFYDGAAEFVADDAGGFNTIA